MKTRLIMAILFLIGYSSNISAAVGSPIRSAYPQLPLYFETNHGQSDPAVKFMARGPGYSLFLTSSEATLVLRQSHKETHAIRITLKGSTPHPVIEELGLLTGKSNYFFGKDSTQWLTHVTHYSKVAYRQIYPGIDMIYEGDGPQLEYSFIVAPGADPALIRMDFKGADDLRLDAAGNLILSLKKGAEATFKAPTLYQTMGGRRVFVDGRFVLTNEKLIRFEVGDYNPRKELIIDPTLTYSTYLGGTVDDRAYAVAVDASGNTYVTGETTSNLFPGAAGHYQAANGGGASDVFVTKINAAGTAVLWSTYVGGASDDQANSIAVDGSGNVYITGYTSAGGYPTTAAFQAASAGGTDAFVTAINAAGTALIYSTYLGGAGEDAGNSIAVDAAGLAYITGHTTSADFPASVGAFQTLHGGADDAFVASFNATGIRRYISFLGGTTADHGNGIAVDSLGNAYVTGQTSNGTFPITPLAPPGAAAFKTTITGSHDAFISKVNPTGTLLLYSTFVGGSVIDEATAIALDSSNNVYITGFTYSADFPTIDILFNPKRVGQTAISTAPDAYVFKLKIGNGGGSNDGVYSTYLGATTDDRGMAIAVDGYGDAYVSGHTTSGDFPTVNPLPGQTTLTATGKAFVTEVGPTGAALLFSTYLGGLTDQAGQGIALDSSNNIYVAGWTNSTDFPTSLPIQAGNAGSFDAFAAKISAPTPPPSPPTAFTGTALGISSISWNWNAVTDATAYHIYLASSTTTLVISTPTTNFIETGLSSNTAYGRVVAAVVNSVETPLSPAATTYTFAATPGQPVFTNVFYTSFTVTWSTNNPAGTRFEVSRSTTNDNFATAVSTPIAFTDSFILGATVFVSLRPGSTYYLRIRAENGTIPGAGIPTAFSAVASTAALPTPPTTGLAGTALGVSSISWTWDAVPVANSYNIYQATSPSTLIVSTPSVGFTETGLSSNTAYGRVISALLNGVESALSPSATTYTLAASPGPGVFTNVFSTSFTITWAATNPAGTRFEVSRSTTNDNFATSVSTPIAFTDSFILDTTHFIGLVPGTRYYLRIRAENGAAAGAGVATAFSATASTTTLSVPVVTGLHGTALGISSISWTWNAVPAAFSYNIYQATSPGTLIVSTPSVGFTETGLSNNTAYGRVITTFINGVESALSPSATIYTFAATPGAGIFTNVFATSFTVTWTTNNPVGTRFEVSRSTTNDNFATAVSTPIAFTDSFILGTVDFTGLVPNETYYLRIRAENGAVAGAGIVTAFSAASSTVTMTSLLPTGLLGTPLGSSSIRWTWNAAAGASDYNLYQAMSAATLIINTPATTFIETGLSTNTAYGRVVTAIDAGIESGLSVSATAYTWAAVPGPAVPSQIAYSSFTITWLANGNPGYTRYEVSLSTDNFTLNFSTPVAFGSLMAATTDLINLLPGITYFVRIRAENNETLPTLTAFSPTASAVTLAVPTPTSLSGAALGISSVSWTWNNVPDATAYHLYQATSPATLITNTASTGFEETGLLSNTAYGRVVSALINSLESARSPAVTTYTLAAAPGAGVFTTVFSTSFTVTWMTNNPVGTRFEVHYSTTNDGFSSMVSTPIVFADNFILGTANFSGLLPVTTYYLRIWAENGAVAGAGTVTAFSATASTMTLPTPLASASPPVTFSINPITGTDAGGTEVIITGTGLAGATSVTFDGYDALSFTVDSNTQITARSPAQAAGPAVDVVVSRLSGGNAMAGSYTFFAVPVPSPLGPGSYIFPSPADGPTASIVYTMAENGTAEIRVYNEVGDLVTKVQDSKPAGAQASTIHTAWLAPGVYFYILNMTYDSGRSDKRKLKKFVVKH